MHINNTAKTRIDELMRHTTSRLNNIQSNNTAAFYQFPMYEMQNYKFDGIDYKIADPFAKIIYAKDMNLTTKSNKNSMYIKTLREAITSGLITPFIITILNQNNNRLIVDWEDVIVIKDYTNFYFVISFLENFIDIEQIQCLKFNLPFKYIKNVTENITNGYMVDAGGFITHDYTTAAYGIEFKENKDILVREYEPEFMGENKGFRVDLGLAGKEVFLNNLICEYDSCLIPNAEELLEELDNNTFRFRNGVDPDKFKVRVYYYDLANLSLDNIYALKNDTLNEIAEKDILNIAPEFYTESKGNFDISSNKYYADDKYEELYMKIVEYNSTLLDTTKDLSAYIPNALKESIKNFTSMTYTGKELKLIAADGVLELPRKRWISENGLSGLNDILVFKNGYLYEEHNYVTYRGSKVIIRLNAMEDDDLFEIVYLAGNKGENISSLMIASNEQPKTTCALFDLKDSFLFDPNPTPEDIEISPELITDTMQHECLASLKILSDKPFSYNVSLEDERYYGEELIVSPKAKFESYRTIYDGEEEIFNISLPSRFKYCHGTNQFLVFKNGERLEDELFSITIPNKHNPYYEMSVFISNGINNGDLIDVFYIPFEIIETISLNTIPEDGRIVVNGNKLLIGLNRENYWYFINGRKVPNSNIEPISKNSVIITTDMKNTSNLCIVYTGLSPDQVETTCRDDAWSSIISTIPSEDLNEMVRDIRLTDDGENMFDNAVIRKALLIYIYRYYYTSNFTSTAIPYTGDPELLKYLERDAEGNYITPINDAIEDINIVPEN